MQKIVLIGAGNVASHLFTAFQKTETVHIIQVYNRSNGALKHFEKKVATTTSLAALKSADIYIVAVSDAAVRNVITQINPTNGLIVHTSGSVPLLNSSNRNGVFYPLQTFSKQTSVNFSDIPICIEATTSKDLETLRTLGKSISHKIFSISTEQRKKLHLAAVFACNFTNHLYALAEKICTENNVPFETLYALITETARKAQTTSPKNVQTGPAVRSDSETIAAHLQQLTTPKLKEIYTLLTQSIQAENESKL